MQAFDRGPVAGVREAHARGLAHVSGRGCSLLRSHPHLHIFCPCAQSGERFIVPHPVLSQPYSLPRSWWFASAFGCHGRRDVNRCLRVSFARFHN
eukprot:351353-Chlamydomonas_euryale.AAC.3